MASEQAAKLLGYTRRPNYPNVWKKGHVRTSSKNLIRQAIKFNQQKEVTMTHVFEGQPDARQGGDIKPSRFRPRYRQLSADEKQIHDAIKDKAVEMEELYNQVKDGRYKALSITSLEESVMWIVKELTA